MKIVIPKEQHPGENRVSATPETVKKMAGWGGDVYVETGAGVASKFPDSLYQAAGATILPLGPALYEKADVILKVQRPSSDEIALYPEGAVLIGSLSVLTEPIDIYVHAKLTAVAMEMLPRITRAQTMDILSSQSNLAGYKAVVDAAANFNRAFPMMMTAAGTIMPAKVLILGAGVAGLQAIATAKRLGAVVSAFDVRPQVKEQVESLGARFIEVDPTNATETTGGYAKEMDEEYKKKQAALLQKTLKDADIVISTALIPGKKAPILITEDMVKEMKPGSMIVDLAAEMGGNCALTIPGENIEKYGVQIRGESNLPSYIATDASSLYARNMMHFLDLIFDKETQMLKWNFDDPLIAATTVVYAGKIRKEL